MLMSRTIGKVPARTKTIVHVDVKNNWKSARTIVHVDVKNNWKSARTIVHVDVKNNWMCKNNCPC